jgi:hypothetical protein
MNVDDLLFQVVPQAGNKNPEIVVRDADAKFITGTTGNLANEKGRKSVAEELAPRLGVDVGVLCEKLHDAWVEYRNKSEQGEQPPPPVTRYSDDDGYLARLCPSPLGDVPVALANFTSRIVEQRVVDDGAEQYRTVVVQGKMADGTALPRYEVPADQFSSMRWPVAAWGSRAVVSAGMGSADHCRAAIQILSGNPPLRTAYAHIGWREIQGRWVYLHADVGNVGFSGTGDNPPCEVVLNGPLCGYALPAAPSGAELVAAVRASLAVLEVAPGRITAPLLGAVYRAVLGPADYSLHLAGPTQVKKTELAALAQQHWGAGMHSRNLPGSWSSTGNSLEALAFAAKDAILTVDDFAPHGSVADVARYHREADRLLRAQGNRSGRARCRTDGTVRPARCPRGTILSTGEDVPHGQSLRARVFILEVAEGDVSLPRLTQAQRAAAAGMYAQGLAGYLCWLAPQYPGVLGSLRAEATALRARALAEGQHARTPGIVADLAVGWTYYLHFALHAGAITTQEREGLARRAWAALLVTAGRQAEHVQSAEPAAHFLRMVRAALASGRAHVAAPKGDEPETPQAWGWRQKEVGTGENYRTEWQPQGLRIGWVDGRDLFLEPEAAYAEAQRLAAHEGDSLSVSAQTLRRRLHERGILVRADTARGTLTVRKVLEGQPRSVVHVSTDSIFPCTEPDKPDISSGRAEENVGLRCRVSPGGGQNPTAQLTTKPDIGPEKNGQMSGLSGCVQGKTAPKGECSTEENEAPQGRPDLYDGEVDPFPGP